MLAGAFEAREEASWTYSHVRRAVQDKCARITSYDISVMCLLIVVSSGTNIFD